MLHRALFAVLTVSALGVQGVHAQSAPAPAEKGEGPVTVQDEKGRSLSEKLGNSDGVIRPQQDPDPAIRQAPLDAGAATTPVIPPPGAPGGNPTVQPK